MNHLYRRRRLIGLFLLCGLIHVAVTLLYGLPLSAALYPAALCLCLGAGALLMDGRRCRKKRRILTGIRTGEDLRCMTLPAPEGAMEEDYQALLYRLGDSQEADLAEQRAKYREMLDYFTVWAHQVKTPIAAMDLKLQRADSALARELTADLRRIDQYTQMVLTYLRLDSEDTDFLFREYPLDDLIRKSIRPFAGEFIHRRLSLSYDGAEGSVVTDEKWLCFVLEQILSNALKYTKSGGVAIFLEGPGRLCVRDTGIGIAPEDLPRVFDKGYTGASGRTDRRSTGIGLYLCKRILTRLGHGVFISSTLGEGTTVCIDLRQRELMVE